MTTTGRIGNLGPQGAIVHSDTLTANYIGEVKSSSRKAKNPGHRITVEAIKKLLADVETMREDFGVELRPVYSIKLPGCPTMIMTTEQWFFRMMIALDTYLYELGLDESYLDEDIARRLKKITKRYR